MHSPEQYTFYKNLLLFGHLIMSDSVTAWTIAHQALLSIGFSRQEFWNGLPFPSPGDLHDPGTEHVSPALQVNSLSLNHQGSPEKPKFGKKTRVSLFTIPIQHYAERSS